jgi:hypothetical protein
MRTASRRTEAGPAQQHLRRRDHRAHRTRRRPRPTTPRRCGRAPGRRARPEHGGVGVRDRPELRNVALAERDRAGTQQPGDAVLLHGGDEVLPALRAHGQPGAGEEVQVLDRHRHAVERAELLAGSRTLVGGGGGVAGAVGQHLDVAADRRIEPFDPGEEEVHELPKPDLADVEPTDQRGHGREVELEVVVRHGRAPGRDRRSAHDATARDGRVTSLRDTPARFTPARSPRWWPGPHRSAARGDALRAR